MNLQRCIKAPLFALLVFSLSACVSKKKHVEMLEALKGAKALQEAQFKVQMDNADQQIESLTLQLAERKGENNALLGMQNRYEEKIKALENEMDQMGTKAIDERNSMAKTLEEKEQIIGIKDKQIQNVRGILGGDGTGVMKLSEAIKNALPDLKEDELSVEVRDGKSRVVLYEKLLFRTGSVSRLNPGGLDALEAIAKVLQDYPAMFVTIVGHTDNRPPAIKSYKDNWNFSVLRAATIARNIVGEFEIGANQILAAGKAEFEPKASNESKEGRAKNRRIELIIAPSIEDQARRIRAAIK